MWQNGILCNDDIQNRQKQIRNIGYIQVATYFWGNIVSSSCGSTSYILGFGSLSMTGRNDTICIRPIVALSSTVHMVLAYSMDFCQKKRSNPYTLPRKPVKLAGNGNRQ